MCITFGTPPLWWKSWVDFVVRHHTAKNFPCLTEWAPELREPRKRSCGFWSIITGKYRPSEAKVTKNAFASFMCNKRGDKCFAASLPLGTRLPPWTSKLTLLSAHVFVRSICHTWLQFKNSISVRRSFVSDFLKSFPEARVLYIDVLIFQVHQLLLALFWWVNIIGGWYFSWAATFSLQTDFPFSSRLLLRSAVPKCLLDMPSISFFLEHHTVGQDTGVERWIHYSSEHGSWRENRTHILREVSHVLLLFQMFTKKYSCRQSCERRMA